MIELQIKLLADRFYSSFRQRVEAEIEEQRKRAEGFKTNEMATYGLTPEQFDALIQADMIYPGSYRIVTNAIASDRVKQFRKDFDLSLRKYKRHA